MLASLTLIPFPGPAHPPPSTLVAAVAHVHYSEKRSPRTSEPGTVSVPGSLLLQGLKKRYEGIPEPLTRLGLTNAVDRCGTRELLSNLQLPNPVVSPHLGRDGDLVEHVVRVDAC